MTTRLEYRHNNAYDAVILVDDETGIVRSNWTVSPQVMRDYCDCSQDAGDWEDHSGDEHTPEQYGELIAVRRGYALEIVDEDKWPKRVEFICH